MKHQPAIDVIRREHASLSAVMHGLLHFARCVRDNRPVPDYKVFRAMLYYVDVFPERFHHPKEDRYLFARLRLRTHEADDILSRLEGEHASGERKVRELMQTIIRLEMGGAAHADEFVSKVEAYAGYHSRHMGLEEELVLPLSEQVLKPEDWEEINGAFLHNQDPLLGVDARKGFDQLFTRIVTIAPPPIGVGPEIAGGR
jgi:hemerythrin-like domain-containing protein